MSTNAAVEVPHIEMRDSHARPIIESLNDAHGASLLSWARGRFADQRDAEEVVADTLVLAWRKFDQYDSQRGTERAWLFGIARNVAVDRYRKSRRHLRSVSVDEVQDPDPQLDFDIDRFVENSHVYDALDALSEDHRVAVVEAYFHGRTANDIGHRHHVPSGTIKSRLHYALKALRGQLEEKGVIE